MKPPRTEIVCVLDRSGSMATLRDDAIAGHDTFIEQHAQLPGEIRLTLALFRDDDQLPVRSAPPAHAPRLDRTTYVPDGSTALLDAIGRATAPRVQVLLSEGDIGRGDIVQMHSIRAQQSEQGLHLRPTLRPELLNLLLLPIRPRLRRMLGWFIEPSATKIQDIGFESSSSPSRPRDQHLRAPDPRIYAPPAHPFPMPLPG